jgi:multidrug efflux pump subunit AcrA (membrane-fusion protein)
MSLNAASLVDLKAELARKQEQFRQERLNPEQRDIRLQVRRKIKRTRMKRGQTVEQERERERVKERERDNVLHPFLPFPSLLLLTYEGREDQTFCRMA